jgi:hypothetical protein
MNGINPNAGYGFWKRFAVDPQMNLAVWRAGVSDE